MSTTTIKLEARESIEAKEKFVKDVSGLWEKLNLSPHPTLEQLTEMVDLCTTVQGNMFRFLKRPRKGPSKNESVLFERLRWHNVLAGGTGWLGGPINSAWMVDAETFDMLDTFATLVSLGMGRKSWTDEWAKILGIKI